MGQNKSPKSRAIILAAKLAKGDRYDYLYDVCEKQKTINTERLRILIEDMHDADKQDAIEMRAISDAIEL